MYKLGKNNSALRTLASWGSDILYVASVVPIREPNMGIYAKTEESIRLYTCGKIPIKKYMEYNAGNGGLKSA